VPPLPLAPPPLAGELLGSWVGRLACLYGLPPQRLWNELAGLPASGFVWVGGAGVPWVEQIGRVAAAARLERRALIATTVEAMFANAPAGWLRPTLISIARIPWCPACLHEDQAQGRAPHLRRLWAAGCVVVCPRHFMPLTDVCRGCGRPAPPVFHWIGSGPVVACGLCHALLSSDGVPPYRTGDPSQSRMANVPPAAVIATRRVQAMVLRALRGRPLAAPDGPPIAAIEVIATVERLMEDLLFPLGIIARPGPAMPMPAAHGQRSIALGLFGAGAAFALLAAVAALLALSGPAALRDGFMALDPQRLWALPVGGEAVPCLRRREACGAAAGIGTVGALALRQDPEIAALMAVRPSIVAPPHPERPRPHRPETRRHLRGADRWYDLARLILADPRTMARVATAGSPARRRRMLGRLARAALQAEQRRGDAGDWAAVL
jgi:hypothetical protein